ncbi:MAG: acetyl-CoA carboxylase biotin carboxyl carrier protein subunit, partial [Treponema sp.]|nr:acetyl-CoA carboxylase biotin carboxyl carrier protein subunit [Treponema sp.]
PAVTGGVEVKAPVAGTLLRHVAAAGSSVKKGDTVIMIESMKMELEVKAPESGTINFVVQPGTQIQAGQVLATLGGVAVAAPAPQAAPAPTQNSAGIAPAIPVSNGGAVTGKPVNAPVAGTLLKYAVAEGAAVKADTTIIIVESMKMELEIKAGNAGSVHFLAATGSQISAGQAIAEIK